MKNTVLCSCLIGSFALIAETIVPNVTSVTKANRDSGSSSISVTYVLDAPAVVTFDLYTNGVPVDSSILGAARGDVFKKVSSGIHSFSWKVVGALPETTVITNGGAFVRVKAWSLGAPPDYMVIDLSKANGDIHYYETAGQVPQGVTDDKYKTTHLVMRKVPAAYLWWDTGCPTNGIATLATPHKTLLTSDYYLAVYELTVAQNAYMTSNSQTSSEYPFRSSFDGCTASLVAFNEYSGLGFRMPTCAEWEFACRAGCENSLYTGVELTGLDESPNLDSIAWYGYNSAEEVSQVTPHEVGLLQPNDWGFYDMLGNVWEWCSDWYTTYTFTDQIDPTGVASHTQRARRGGAYDSPAQWCTAYAQQPNAPHYSNDSRRGVNGETNNNQGIRLCLPCYAVR